MNGYNPGKLAGQNWKEDYNSMLLSFNRDAVFAAMVAFTSVEMSEETKGATEEELYTILSIAFVQLLKRGAIEPIRPLSTEGERQLSELQANFNVVAGPPEPEDESLSIAEQVIHDWDTIGMKAFAENVRTDSKYEKAYLKLIEQGRLSR